VKSAVERHVTAVKSAVQKDGAFGVGLRLSARAATELSRDREIASFRAMLADKGL